MSTEPEESEPGALLDDIKARIDDLADELEQASGRAADRVDELRTRIESMRGGEPEPPLTKVETLRRDLEDLRAEIEGAFEERRERLSPVLDDVEQRVRQLERTIRRG